MLFKDSTAKAMVLRASLDPQDDQFLPEILVSGSVCRHGEVPKEGWQGFVYSTQMLVA